MKLLGIDYGDSKVGVAIGDTASGQSLPLMIIKNSGFNSLFQELKKIVDEESIECIVVGLPINDQAINFDQSKKVKHFIGQLQSKLSIDVAEQDERFSTQEAQKLKRGGREDDVAAMLILQAYMSRMA